MQLYFTRLCNSIILGWILVVSFGLSIILETTPLQTTYFQFGPNESFLVFGIPVNTYGRYLLLCFYSIVNAGVRALYQNVVHPWVLHNVQDETIEKKREMHIYAYQFTMVSTVYIWFDWFIYMNVLLSQVDMLLMELFADASVSLLTTYLYLNPEQLRLFYEAEERQPMRQDIPVFS
jgi:hypothetical protein